MVDGPRSLIPTFCKLTQASPWQDTVNSDPWVFFPLLSVRSVGVEQGFHATCLSVRAQSMPPRPEGLGCSTSPGWTSTTNVTTLRGSRSFDTYPGLAHEDSCRVAFSIPTTR